MYRELYRGLPDTVTDPSRLPVTTKPLLMSRFDSWVTDPSVTLDQVASFVEDTTLVGEMFLGRYTVATTSGTTGTRGYFLLDRRTLTVTQALTARMLNAWLRPRDVVRIVTRGGRIAMVAATGGHYASAAAAAGLRKNALRRRRIGVFSVQARMVGLVAGLNRFQPAILAPYASTGVLLAAEQAAARLHIRPVLVVLSAEGLRPGDEDRIAAAFGAKVRQGYAATECPFLSYSCQHGWLHLNSDWAILEPVDADYQPVPAGQQSHTSLLTNLANRVQPVLRYDLGDSILVRPDPCPCGDPLPALRVNGRSADLLTFSPAHPSDPPLTLTPLTLSSLLDRVPGITLAQIVQTTPTSLTIRLQSRTGADLDHVRAVAHRNLSELLKEQGLAHVIVTFDERPPQPTAGGKIRNVIPLPKGS
ncbi:MAG: phenylacetate--CoA ligase family protein [Mycobacterium sp.]